MRPGKFTMMKTYPQKAHVYYRTPHGRVHWRRMWEITFEKALVLDSNDVNHVASCSYCYMKLRDCYNEFRKSVWSGQ